MTKPLSLTISFAAAILSMAAATAPSQAATRLMSSSLEGFQYRCENHGGSFGLDGALASCQTPSVPVACEYFEDRQAICNWPGIERQIDVIRVIGSLPAGYEPSSSGGSQGNGGGNGGNGGGGIQGPKDIKDAPNNPDPKPNFDGPDDFQMAPDNNPDPKPNFDGPKDLQMAP
ncbi:hypothetical protein [Devosia sp.]|uniref:hypothetical protein n=1 Tax=Devosia sp. TaxID=1871048 RepID=UPI00292E0EB0|nr:hypothetical protein [Devosia sp.]